MTRLLPILAAAALFTQPTLTRASILTFDIFDPSDARYSGSEDFPEGYAVYQQYGDRVTSSSQTLGTTTFEYGEGGEGYTPNVVVEYGPFSIFTGGPSLWRYDYGDLVRVLYQGSTVAEIGFNYDFLVINLRADYGYDALLYGFDLGGWFQTDYEINSVSVYDAQFNEGFPALNRVFHDPNATVLGVGPTHTSYAFDTPIRGNVISILIDANNLGDTSELIGIDNIRFGQDIDPDPGPAPVPEPSSALLLAAGLGALALRARRN